jgi:hypothetical protein
VRVAAALLVRWGVGYATRDSEASC